MLAESRQARISTPPAVAALEPLVESIIALRLDRADRASELLKDVPPELQNMFGPKFRAASLRARLAEEQQSNWEEARRAFQSSLALDPTVEKHSKRSATWSSHYKIRHRRGGPCSRRSVGPMGGPAES